QLQVMAVAKKYHFSSEQDQLIANLTTSTNKMFAHGWVWPNCHERCWKVTLAIHKECSSYDLTH
ncbi:hypothetical protein J8137_21300, partial [Lactiplantibacillus plantarum]|nr:hypothetical protein [Lactiplantibacillus plantarum]